MHYREFDPTSPRSDAEYIRKHGELARQEERWNRRLDWDEFDAPVRPRPKKQRKAEEQ